MQISVIMAYFQRPEHLHTTLDSYAHFYADGPEFEVVIVDDSSADPQELPRVVEGYPFPIRTEYLDRRHLSLRNPGPVMNRAVELARAPLLALTNPENMHCGPVLRDALTRAAERTYVVYGCRTLKLRPAGFREALADLDALTDWETAGGWYQHGTIFNRLLHFMSVIRAEDYRAIGGFDSRYDDGVGYDDNDFAEQVVAAGFDVVTVDDPFVAHQAHGRGHWNEEALARNKAIFRRKWGHGDRVFGAGGEVSWPRRMRNSLRRRLRGLAGS